MPAEGCCDTCSSPRIGTVSPALLVGCGSASDQSSARPPDAQDAARQQPQVLPSGMPRELMLHTWLPNEQSGLNRPPTVEALQADLKDDAEVLGVEVKGNARAYRLAALRDINHHIVNDTVNGVPVSVLYCDINDCARAYTGPAGSDPLPIRQAGMKFGDLTLKVGNIFYQHSTTKAMAGTTTPGEPDPSLPPFPFAPIAVTRTTWGAWKQQHPTTDVYLGAVEQRHPPVIPPQISASPAGKSEPRTTGPDSQ